jgi:hypothetical protein
MTTVMAITTVMGVTKVTASHSPPEPPSNQRFYHMPELLHPDLPPREPRNRGEISDSTWT